MRYLIETQYFVTLKIFHIKHDPPSIGVYERTLEEFGPFETKEAAETQELTLQEGHKSNIGSDVEINIEEREVSRLPVDSVEVTRIITLESS